MNVNEARRTRHLVIRLDHGDELPSALVRALDEAEARSAWIVGTGTLEAADLAVYDPRARGYAPARRIEGGLEIASLTGNVATQAGATTVRLSAVVAREGELGLETFGGLLVWGRAVALELDVVVLDDLALTRVTDERSGLPVLTARPVGASVIAEPAGVPAAAIPLPAAMPQPAAIPLPAAPAPAPPAAPAQHHDPRAMPQRPGRPSSDEVEIYPEAGDLVIHFHFGECTVVDSDGDKIRLRQDREGGRVREVALPMLKIEPPTRTSDGRRLFKLGRKN